MIQRYSISQHIFLLPILPSTLLVHSDSGTLSYKTRTKALKSGDHGPRVRTPADRSRTSAGRTWASTSGSRTSSRPEPSEPAEGPGPCPIRAGVRSPHKPLWVRSPTPGSGAATCPTGPTSGPLLPAWAGVRNRHVPLWKRPPTPGSGAATCPTCTSLLPEASPPAELNAGGWGVHCQSRASDTHSRVGQA